MIDFEKTELSQGLSSVFSIDVDNRRQIKPSKINFKDNRVQRLHKNFEPPPTQDEISK